MKNISWTTRLLFALLVIATAAGSAYLWWRYTPGSVAEGCNLHQRACSQSLPDGGRVVLEMNPKPLDFSHPIHVEARLENIAPQDVGDVAIDFTGLDFPTSFIRAPLKPAGEGRFEGEIEIPACLYPAIDWQASVLWGQGEARHAAPFVFNAMPSAGVTHPAKTQLSSQPSGGLTILKGTSGSTTLTQFHGQVVVAFFGYTAAPVECPQPIAVIDRMLASLSAEERAKVTVIMVALDSQGDAPAQLEPALQATHSPNYRVVTGADADLIGAARLFGAAFEPLPPLDGKVRIAHTAHFYLIGLDGHFAGQIGSQSPEHLTAGVRRLLKANAN